MLWLHPALQTLTIGLAAWVLFMGLQRFRFQHLGVKCAFPWKRHVFWGKAAVALWFVGWAGGAGAARLAWGDLGLSGAHFFVGTLMLPLLLVSLATGLKLQKPSGKRPGLALTHGAANVALFLASLHQAYSAVEIIELFLL